MKNISFVIPSYNCETTIANTINSIKNQNYKGKVEIVVIDDLSKDNSVKEISKFKNVKLIVNEKNLGLSNSLNKAMKATKYDVIGLLFCDCELSDKNWINRMIEVLNSDEKIGSVCSIYALPKEAWKDYSFVDKAIFSREYYLSVTGKKGGGKHGLMRKKVLEKLNYYDSKNYRIAGEDTDLLHRIEKLGYKVVLTKNKVIHYHASHHFSLKQHLFDKALPLGEAIGVNFRRHGFNSMGNKYWNAFSSTFVYLGLFVPYVRWVSLFVILGITSLFILHFLRYSRDVRIVFLPFLKITKDIFNIIGFWKGFITNRQSF